MAATTSRVYIDDREFNRALGQYLALADKDTVEVLNKKTRDWMLKSARATPKAQRKKISDAVENPKFITWFLNEAYGKGQWIRSEGGLGRGEVSDTSDWATAVMVLRRRFSSIGYLRSPFVKAARKIPASGGHWEGNEANRNPRYRHFRTKARVVRATIMYHRTIFDLTTDAVNPSDANVKESIQMRAVSVAQQKAADDMMKYITRKMVKNARKVSRKGK